MLFGELEVGEQFDHEEWKDRFIKIPKVFEKVPLKSSYGDTFIEGERNAVHIEDGELFYFWDFENIMEISPHEDNDE